MKKSFNTKNLFYVYYTAKGAWWIGRCLVKAKDKTTAKKLVKQLDHDYIRLKAYTLEKDASHQELAELAKSIGPAGCRYEGLYDMVKLASVAGEGEHWSSRLAR